MMNIIKRLLTQLSLTRILDKSFKDVGKMLENMDSEARKQFAEVAIGNVNDRL